LFFLPLRSNSFVS